MTESILLITSVDETFQKPLLENEGYRVRVAAARNALEVLQSEEFRLVLVTTETSASDTIELCVQIKTVHPAMRVAVLAQRAEYIPKNACIDAIIRSQHSPNKFLATIRTLVEKNGSKAFGAAFSDDDTD